MKDWVAGQAGRHLDAIETHECPQPLREDGHAWWLSPENEDDGEDAQGEEEE